MTTIYARETYDAIAHKAAGARKISTYSWPDEPVEIHEREEFAWVNRQPWDGRNILTLPFRRSHAIHWDSREHRAVPADEAEEMDMLADLAGN